MVHLFATVVCFWCAWSQATEMTVRLANQTEHAGRPDDGRQHGAFVASLCEASVPNSEPFHFGSCVCRDGRVPAGSADCRRAALDHHFLPEELAGKGCSCKAISSMPWEEVLALASLLARALSLDSNGTNCTDLPSNDMTPEFVRLLSEILKAGYYFDSQMQEVFVTSWCALARLKLNAASLHDSADLWKSETS